MAHYELKLSRSLRGRHIWWRTRSIAGPKEGRAAAAGFRMPGAPVANWVVVAFLLFVTAMLWFQPDTRVALYVAPV